MMHPVTCFKKIGQGERYAHSLIHLYEIDYANVSILFLGHVC